MSELKIYLAVTAARAEIRRGALISKAVRESSEKFEVDRETVWEFVTTAEDACQDAKELFWRERRQANPIVQEPPTIISSLSAFDWA